MNARGCTSRVYFRTTSWRRVTSTAINVRRICNTAVSSLFSVSRESEGYRLRVRVEKEERAKTRRRRRDVGSDVVGRSTQSFEARQYGKYGRSFAYCQYFRLIHTRLLIPKFSGSSTPWPHRTVWRGAAWCGAARRDTATRHTAALNRAVSTERLVIRGTSTFAFWHFALVR